jgi:glucuronokinase
MIIKTHAYARAGLIGNPSDGFYGKTISLIMRNYKAQVTLYESPEISIESSAEDISHFHSIGALCQDVRRHGYYGGVRLIKASIKRFADYGDQQGLPLAARNFTIRYVTNIPRLVGLAGSSAIVTAAMRALMSFYEVAIPKPALANLILSVEREELGISAGLQDRVIQVYEGVMFMDFAREIMQTQGYGRYEALDPQCLPPLYVAFDPHRSQSSEQVHNPVRALFERGDPKVTEAMRGFAELAEQARQLLLAGRGREIGPLMNRNFDLRSTIYPISEENRKMIMTARRTGAAAKFAGSGGAVIGLYEDEQMYAALQRELGQLQCVVFKPDIA